MTMKIYNYRNIVTYWCQLAVVIYSFIGYSQVKAGTLEKPNVLFIAVDDLRPELGCYGKSNIHSPNIDRLANSGIVFTNAYANYPVCGASRASLLSGVYPSESRFLKWNCSQDDDIPGIVSLPMHFRNNNYETVSLGKVYNNFDDGKGSWVKNWRPPVSTTDWDYQSKAGIQIFEERNAERFKNNRLRNNDNLPQRGPAYERADVPDIAYDDGRIAMKAIEQLQEFQNSSDPFFLAVGFHKPHLPFNAPEKYWAIYDKDDIKLPSNYDLPQNAPESAKFNWPELRAYYDIPSDGPLPDSTALNLIHGYYACISYVDAQIGKVLNALEEYGLAQNTIVVLWGDHGWFLGEHGFWSKHSNLRIGAHAPLIVKVPWMQAGFKIDNLVEFVDIYPTLCKLAGLSLPIHLQGESLVPMIENPESVEKRPIFFRNGNGETIIAGPYAYTEWIDYDTGKVKESMLFNHQSDPQENINIAEQAEYKELILNLHNQLYEHLKLRDRINIAPKR